MHQEIKLISIKAGKRKGFKTLAYQTFSNGDIEREREKRVIFWEAIMVDLIPV